MNGFVVLMAVFGAFFSFSVSAAEISKGGRGSVILSDGSISINYKDVLGSKDGLYRGLIVVNGHPALLTSGEEDIIYTLEVVGGKILIDCAIAESRSNQSGISIRKSMCGIDKELWSDYSELGYSYIDLWKEQAAGVDVSSLVAHGKPLDIVQGMIEGVEVHQVYRTLSQLEDAAPQIYLKRDGECYEVPDSKVFVSYSAASPGIPAGIMIFDDIGGYDFRSYAGGDVGRFGFKYCK
ncbi:hypothetical protein [Pseudomonas nicosulfuronedens]